jgi:hypothetical protein
VDSHGFLDDISAIEKTLKSCGAASFTLPQVALLHHFGSGEELA